MPRRMGPGQPYLCEHSRRLGKDIDDRLDGA